jgi:hypothetical protein
VCLWRLLKATERDAAGVTRVAVEPMAKLLAHAVRATSRGGI